MGKGRYLKSAERACAGKARFDTPQEAERTAEYRYAAYLCPVCHRYHLTSRARPSTTPQPELPPPPKVPGPKLGDLDWTAALQPGQPKPPRPPKPKKPKPIPPPPPPVPQTYRCLGPAGKDGRVPLLVDGALVKSAKVGDHILRRALAKDVFVVVAPNTDPPVIWRVAT